MNADTVRPRRSPVSLLLGVLAMGGSLAALGTVVLSDVAAASEPPAQEQVQVQLAEEPREQQVHASVKAPSGEPLLDEPLELEPRPVKKRPSKKGKLDFGRFEGY